MLSNPAIPAFAFVSSEHIGFFLVRVKFRERDINHDLSINNYFGVKSGKSSRPVTRKGKTQRDFINKIKRIKYGKQG